MDLQIRLKQADEPSIQDLKILRQWFLDTKEGNRPLLGKDKDLWEESSHKSLIALKPRKGPDPLTAFFLHRVWNWWHHFIGHRFIKQSDLEAQFIEYSDNSLERLANILGAVISSAILVGSIVALYFINSTAIRLVAIAAFTLIFSLVLVLVAGARKVDMFAATAA